MYAWPSASLYVAVSLECTTSPARRSPCPTRVVPAKRSQTRRTGRAAVTRSIRGSSRRFEPMYLTTAPARVGRRVDGVPAALPRVRGRDGDDHAGDRATRFLDDPVRRPYTGRVRTRRLELRLTDEERKLDAAAASAVGET